MSDYDSDVDFADEAMIEETYQLSTATKKLLRYWMNEKSCPEILPYDAMHFEYIVTAINHQKSKMQSLPIMTQMILQSDVERLSFIVRDYLNIRLQKIHKYCSSMVMDNETGDDSVMSRLSTVEKEFATKLHEARMNHLNAQALDALPRAAVNTEKNKVQRSPNTDVFITCRALEEVPNLLVDGEEGTQSSQGGAYLDIVPGNTYILKYSAIKDLLLEDRIELV